MFLAVALVGFWQHGRLFWACRGFVWKANCNEKMNAEEQQRLDGLERDLGQLKLALDNSDRKFDKLENYFDELKR